MPPVGQILVWKRAKVDKKLVRLYHLWAKGHRKIAARALELVLLEGKQCRYKQMNVVRNC